MATVMDGAVRRGAIALARIEGDETAFQPARLDGITRSGNSEEYYLRRAQAVINAALLVPQPGSLPRRRWVLAPNYPEFAHWCSEQGLSPRDVSVRYLQDPTRQLRGAPACVEIVRLEGWATNTDYRHYLDEIRHMLERHEAAPRNCTADCGSCKGGIR